MGLFIHIFNKLINCWENEYSNENIAIQVLYKLINRETDENCIEDIAFENQVKNYGVEYTGKQIANLVNEKITNRDLALWFVLEELDAARYGNDYAQNFSKNSGFDPIDYIGAMDKTDWGGESDLEHIQLFLRNFIYRIKDEELMVKLSTVIVDEIMKKWKLGKYENRTNLNTLKSKKLISADHIESIVKRRSSAGLGGFVDLNNDLGQLIEENQNHNSGLLMPYFYARRIAVAGMFSQGVIKKEEFDRVESLFFNYMVQVGSEISKETQVNFQNESADRAIELAEKYILGVTRQSVQMLIHCAKQGFSLRDALINGINVDNNQLKKIVKPVMYRDLIMKSDYCMCFFATGWYRMNNDFESISENIIRYLRSTGINLYIPE